MTVYLDLVVLLNVMVDFLLLTGTNRLAGYPAGVKGAAAAAVLGGIYGGACLIPGLDFLGNMLWRVVSLGLMGVIAFGVGPGTVRRCILFLVLSFALGGIALGLGNGSLRGLLLAAGALCLLCLLGFRGKVGNRYVPVTLAYNGKIVELFALHDTGNTLRDPVTGERVLILGAEAARRLTGLTVDQLRCPVDTAASGIITGLRLIPYRAVGRSQGMLLALRVTGTVGERTGQFLAAFTPEGLGEGNGEFEALIGGTL